MEKPNDNVGAVRQKRATLMGTPLVLDGPHGERVRAGRNGGSMGIDTSNPQVSMDYDIVHS